MSALAEVAVQKFYLTFFLPVGSQAPSEPNSDDVSQPQVFVLLELKSQVPPGKLWHHRRKDFECSFESLREEP